MPEKGKGRIMQARKMAGMTGMAAAILLLAAGMAQADTIIHGGTTINMDFVTVGNPGNTADDTGYGAVGYAYKIGKYEVTADQWAAVVAADSGLRGAWWNPTGSQPMGNITWNEAAKFCNWLTTGSTTSGYYTISAGVASIPNGASHYAYAAANGTTYFIPTEDEWYKAAYHKNNGVTGGADNYWDYPTGSDTVPTAVTGGTGAGTAVFVGNGIRPTAPAVVSNAGGLSAYGTMGQGGNVSEWNETPGVYTWTHPDNPLWTISGTTRGLRGGSFASSGSNPNNGILLASSTSSFYWDPYTSNDWGLRVAAIAPRTHVLTVGVRWDSVIPGDLLRGDLDADHLAGALQSSMPSVTAARTERLELSSSVSGGSNLLAFETAFDRLVGAVLPGDTIILSFASHGDSNVLGTEAPFNTNLDAFVPYGKGPMQVRTGDEYVLLSEASKYAETDRLYDDELAFLLADERLKDVRKIVIFDNCRSGGFGTDLTTGVSQIAVLAGCNEGYFTYSALDGTGVFTNRICDGLAAGPDRFPKADGYGGGVKDGTVTLDELNAYIKAFDFGDLMGQELALRYVEGTGIFQGLDVDFSTSSDFFGGFDSTPEPTTLSLLALGGLAMIRRRRK